MAFAHRVLAVTLATLIFWLPVGPSPALAEDAQDDQASPAEQTVAERLHELARDSEARWQDREVLSQLAETQSHAEQDPEPADREGDLTDDEGKVPALRVPVDAARDLIPLNLPSGPGKSAVSAQAVALPKGEGSIEGMGESFTPNLSSGSGTFSVPVALPAGRNGVQPSLTLSYSTGAGSGVLGFGWSLALPFISRQTDKGLPRYVDAPAWQAEEDTFMYNGGQELVPVDSRAAQRIDGAPIPAELQGFQQYRARVEGGFMRFFRSPDSTRWVVQSTDGTRFDFGSTASPGPRDATKNSGVQADPENGGRIFSWQLVRMSDVHGSTVHYQYFQNGGTPYIESIYYTSPDSCAVVNSPRLARECTEPLSDYAHRVRFVYETRKDVTTSYVSSWRVEQALRLKRIELTSAGAERGRRTLVRRYHLSYDPVSHHSLLTSLQVEGRPSRWDDHLGVFVADDSVPETALTDAPVGELLPPMQFGYTMPPTTFGSVAGFGGIDATVHESPMSPDHSVDEGRADFFDVNADGLPDLLVTDPARYKGGVGVYFNGLDDAGHPARPGWFSQGVRVDVLGALSDVLDLSSANIVPMDVDGDGRSDVLHMPRSRNYGYFVLSKAPSEVGKPYAATQGWSFAHVGDLLPDGETDPRIDLGKDGAFFKTLDVNNDHLIDVVRTTGKVMQTWLNLGRYPRGEGRFGSAQWSGKQWLLSAAPMESCLPYASRNLDFGADDVRIADMNGDGLQDIARVTANEVVWWPGRGPALWGEGGRACDDHNRAGREVRMQRAPRHINPDLSGVHFVDVNEDGASDLVQVGPKDLSVWFNQGGSAFSERLLVKGTPFAHAALDRVRIADIDGSTTTDIVYAESGRYRWLDLMGGKKPRLLTSVQNGLGALTTLEYSSSVEDYLRDLGEAQSCDPEDLECFTWQREPLRPGEREAQCDAHVRAKSNLCVHRAVGSPVISNVVRRVKTSDRLSVLGAAETVSESEYRYHDGYYEGIEQEYRGFAAADALAIGDSSEPTSITRTHFHQGRRPNDIAADRLADNPNETLKGREFLTEVRDERGVYLNTSHASYAVRKILQGLNGVSVSYAYVKASDEYRYDTTLEKQRPMRKQSIASVVREVARAGLEASGPAAPEPGDAPHAITIRHTGYALTRHTIDRVDNLGQLLKQTAWGRNLRGEYGEVVADERIIEHTVPVRVDDTACGATGWLWRTQESYTTGADETLRFGDTVQAYTPCGDARSTTRIARVLSGSFDFSAPAPAASYIHTHSSEIASSEFDPWGQPTLQCGGADSASTGYASCMRLATSTYDAAYHQLVVTESIATERKNGVASFLSTTATWDRGLGAIRSATDPNGLTSEVIYDGLGRLTATILPNIQGCDGARTPTVRIAYDLTSDPMRQPASRVTTTTLLACAGENHADNQIVAHAYVDGLGRKRVALAEGDYDPDAFEDGAAHPWVMSGQVLLNKKGHAQRTFQSVFYDGSPDDYRAVFAAKPGLYKRTLYDAFARPVIEANEDYTFRTRSYHALSADLCDEVDNGFGAEGDRSYAGTCTTERVDGHGRTIDQQLRQRTLDGKSEEHRLFTYYRADGAVARIVRGLTGANVLRPETGYSGLQKYVERKFHYDSLGRRVASEDPDTDNRAETSLAKRTWRYLFNAAGDLAAVRDPRGCGQNLYYDLAGRLLGETYVGCGEAQLGEVASADVPAGSVGLTVLTAPASMHVRYLFDYYPDWAKARVPGHAAGALGRPTVVIDRAQRSILAYDKRGNPVWTAKQLAVIPAASTLSESHGDDGRPLFTGANENSPGVASVVYDELHTYERTASYDHAGRSLESELPRDPDFAGGSPPSVRGRMRYHRTGAPRGADLVIDGVSSPVVDLVSYTRDGLPARTRFGDRAFTGRKATESTVLYDGRRRPIEMLTARSPASRPNIAGSLGGVYTVASQRLSWDGASNLYSVEDLRNPDEWPDGHKPYNQRIRHDALYRVAQIEYSYNTPTKLDVAQDWRSEEARHRANDPMRPMAAPMLAKAAQDRVMSLVYGHDWLANMSTWDDDAHQFYERSIGRITNGNDVASGVTPAQRPAALYLASNLDASAPADLGGWLETDYGAGGNMLALTVHAQCTHASANSCKDEGPTLTARRDGLRAGCACASEQHYVYRWDELNRLHEARRYDRSNQGAWMLRARQRYRYDSANQRMVKQTFDVASGSHRAALYVYPGDFERRGLEIDAEGDAWAVLNDSETQYVVAGARVVWQNRADRLLPLDADHRITFALSNLIGSTSAVVDLVSGELVEAGGFYPNGAREEQLGAADDVSGATVPLEQNGFTGKEADEEVGLTYFGERYLVPHIGRWATPDPASIHAVGGGEGLNSYHYIGGNLLQARDPLGLAPTQAQLQGAASFSSSLGKSGRTDLMNSIGARFGIPAGGWSTGQSRLFQGSDIRLETLLRKLAKDGPASKAAAHLDRAESLTGQRATLVLATAARENASSVTATGTNKVNTWHEGGLDFLWSNRNSLGLPKSVTNDWEEATPFISGETGNEVHPGLIPARDQVLGYAAQMRQSFERFEGYVKNKLGDARGAAVLANLTDDARMVWQAYAFLAPGGKEFDPSEGAKHGQGFGVKSAFGYLLDKASQGGREVDLNEILSDSSLDRTDYVRIAKARSAEAAYVDHAINESASSGASSP